MLTTLYTAVSGMNANGTSLSVIGDNIANQNTVGFKASTVAFGDVLSQTLAGVSGSAQVGRGVLVSSVNPQFTQGSFETTSSALDMAIDGDGFFIVNENGANYYTRAGQFSLDKDGNIVNPDGLVLQGFQADATGNITGTLGDLKMATTQSVASATSSATVAVNLDATAQVPGAAFTLGTPPTTPANYNFSNTISVFDSQGGAHDVTLYYVKTADNAWTVHYVHDDPANPGQLVEAGTQDLTFGKDGSLTDDNSGTAINFDFGGSVTSPQAITFNYGTGTGETPAGTGLDSTTQFASSSAVINLTQDGYSAGSLKNVSISQDGRITGVFTNGQTRTIGQVALAKFVAPTALTKLGKNLYAQTYDSGQPLVGAAGTSGLGSIVSNSLELSNVDLAQEFVNMISAQRGFEANSRIITTTDELMQEVVNLKR
ncbi:MAG TPA: flagellar hook protein FlgE [Thermodesulfovibrionales bacterium]|nr:flagellar hook protein FlgE [Thermodesulfovibrionales bacterium]